MEKETSKPKTVEKTIKQLWEENDKLLTEIFNNPLKYPLAYIDLILKGIYPPQKNKV